MPLPTKCVADVSQAVSTGQLDRAVPAHALAGHRISWHGRPCRVPPGRGVSSYNLGAYYFSKTAILLTICHKNTVLCNPQKSAIIRNGPFWSVARLWQIGLL